MREMKGMEMVDGVMRGCWGVMVFPVRRSCEMHHCWLYIVLTEE